MFLVDGILETFYAKNTGRICSTFSENRKLSMATNSLSSYINTESPDWSTIAPDKVHFFFQPKNTVPSCSKLTTSLVNDSLKFTSSDTQIYWNFFLKKNVSSFCSAKATHIFSAKNIRILYIESAKTVNEMTLNELVKLTTLWTTGPWYFFLFHLKTYIVVLIKFKVSYWGVSCLNIHCGTHKKYLTEVFLISTHNTLTTCYLEK